jgi:hypothetical protein
MARRVTVRKAASTQVVLVLVDNEGPSQKVKGRDSLQEIRIGAPPFYISQVARMAFSFRARRTTMAARPPLVIVLAGPQAALAP